MRASLLPMVLALSLCGCGTDAPVGAVGSPTEETPLLYRTPVDVAVSLVTGRDCSIVILDKKERYCRLREGEPATPVFCTRSLGVADCWKDPAKLPNDPKELGDGPRALTPRQEADRKKRWPGLW